MIMYVLFLVIFFFTGFFAAFLLSAEAEGGQGKFKSLKLRVRSHVVHIHHWMYGSVVLLLSTEFFEKYPWNYQALFYAFIGGIIVHGLTYSDFYKLIYKYKENKEPIPEEAAF